MHLCKIWRFSRVCAGHGTETFTPSSHWIFTESMRWICCSTDWERQAQGAEVMPKIILQWGFDILGFDRDLPTSKACVLIITWNCLAQGEQPLKQKGQLQEKCFRALKKKKKNKLYLLSPPYQGNAVAIDMLTYSFTLSSSLKKHFES